ncbi:MAG TPA: hypothetical protein VLC07_09260 [Solirubrobacterales bacterium]|nr:hypothetical protein [Solirubrobacterales bacterium]
MTEQIERPQHMRALDRANEIRLARAALKRKVAAGKASAADIVEEVPPETESMTIAELLTSQRRWGRTRARKFLSTLLLNENKRLGDLTHRQRKMLVDELRAKLAGGEEQIAA